MPTAKYEIKRKCKVCGATFLAKTLDSVYCSRKCSQVAYDKREAEKKRLERLNEVVESIPDAREYISVAEAVATFGIGRDTIYRLIRSGKIPAINLGQRLTRISRTKLLELYPVRQEPIDRNKTLPKPYHLEPEDCYTIGEISEKFKISESTVYSHIRKYSIPIRQIGRFVYAPKSEIDHLYKDVVSL